MMDATKFLPGPFAAVVLDLDGTLVDTEPIWQRGKEEIFRRYATTFGVADHHAVFGSSEEHAARYFATRFGPGADAETVKREYSEVVAQLLEGGVPTRPGARELLAALRGRVPLGLATNTKRPLVDITLRRSGLAGSFDAETTGDEGRPKPEPDIYLLACRRLGVAPKDAVAIEDSPLGVRAAKAAGLTCVGIPAAPGVDLSQADRTATSLLELF